MIVVIEEATAAAIPAITAIYNEAVLNTTAVWNEKVIEESSRAAWLADHQAAGYPVLVAINDERDVLGYATFGDWRAWEGYRYTVEHSVYVRSDQRGQGIGRTLVSELIVRAQAAGKHALVAGIERNNVASITMHEKLGFRQVGLLHQVGCKFGEWLDLVFLELILDDRANPDAR